MLKELWRGRQSWRPRPGVNTQNTTQLDFCSRRQKKITSAHRLILSPSLVHGYLRRKVLGPGFLMGTLSPNLRPSILQPAERRSHPAIAINECTGPAIRQRAGNMINHQLIAWQIVRQKTCCVTSFHSFPRDDSAVSSMRTMMPSQLCGRNPFSQSDYRRQAHCQHWFSSIITAIEWLFQRSEQCVKWDSSNRSPFFKRGSFLLLQTQHTAHDWRLSIRHTPPPRKANFSSEKKWMRTRCLTCLLLF